MAHPETRLAYVPDKGSSDLVYHYCPADAFNLICTNHTLRLGSIEAMNDSQELKWGQMQFEQYLGKLELETKRNGLKWNTANDLYAKVRHQLTRVCVLAACFSTKADLLSQWRAYADDGRGFAIGFDRNVLAGSPNDPGPRLIRLLYNESEQHRVIDDWIDGVITAAKEETIYSKGRRSGEVYQLAADLAALKNPAFSEESEVRLVQRFDYDNGIGFYAGYREPVLFKMTRGIPVPYVDFDFGLGQGVSPSSTSALRAVMLGPRNPATVQQINAYLETLGYRIRTAERSAASYQ